VTTNRLGREIGAALLMKLVALTLLYFAFFDASSRPTVTPDAMTAKLVTGSAAPRR
jgi:hypothetical protein